MHLATISPVCSFLGLPDAMLTFLCRTEMQFAFFQLPQEIYCRYYDIPDLCKTSYGGSPRHLAGMFLCNRCL